MNRADAEHLARRSGFAARGALFDEILPLTRAAAVDRVLDLSSGPLTTPPAALRDPTGKTWEQARDLRLWWFQQMLSSARPLREKMALFWHGHFATSAEKAYYGFHVVDLIQLFRQHGLGGFHALARGVSQQPWMLSYLDNDRNKASAPNENYARELLELHILGVGNYTERDVLEAARAWSGHHLGDERYAYQFEPRYHDDRNKTIFGITRPWDGPEVIDEVLLGSKRVASARFVVGRLWTHFAYPGPEQSVVDDLVQVYLSANLNLTATMRALFNHPAFWTDRARRGLVFDPAEYVVNAMRATGSNVDESRPDWWLEEMGQDVLYPPTPAGWGKNGYFVNASTMLARVEFASYLGGKARQRDWLAEIEQMSVGQAVSTLMDFMGVSSMSPRTRTVLEDHLLALRRDTEWAQISNMITLALLTPEVALA